MEEITNQRKRHKLLLRLNPHLPHHQDSLVSYFISKNNVDRNGKMQWTIPPQLYKAFPWLFNCSEAEAKGPIFFSYSQWRAIHFHLDLNW